jgi:hypothetical protein
MMKPDWMGRSRSSAETLELLPAPAQVGRCLLHQLLAKLHADADSPHHNTTGVSSSLCRTMSAPHAVAFLAILLFQPQDTQLSSSTTHARFKSPETCA